MSAAQTILHFKMQAVRDIEAGRIKSIIEPRLADHVRREALKIRQRAEAGAVGRPANLRVPTEGDIDMNRIATVKAGFLAVLLSSAFVAVGLVPILAQSPSPLSTMAPGTTVDVCPSPAASPAVAAASPMAVASPEPMASPVALASPVAAASPAVAASPGVMASPAPGACPTGAITEAGISDFDFEPAELAVGVGTTVRWTNEGPSPHTVTADDGSFDSGEMGQGATFEHTFDAAGTFGYFCEIHPAMTGTVTIQ